MTWYKDWDTDFGNNPEDTESRKYGAQQIRWLKDAIVERMQIDHEFGEESIGGAGGDGVDDLDDTGYHKRVTLLKTSIAEAASGYTELAAVGTKLKYFPEGDASREIVDLNQAQTLSNKTLDSDCTIDGADIDNPVLGGEVTVASDFTGVGVAGMAWIDGSDGSGEYNGLITGISRTSTGRVQITYASIAAEHKIVLAQINHSSGANGSYVNVDSQATYADIYTYNSSDALQNFNVVAVLLKFA